MSNALKKTVENIEMKLEKLEDDRKATESEIELKKSQIKSMQAMLAGLERLQGKLG